MLKTTDISTLEEMTFKEIAALYGEETAIQAGIDMDPDTWEPTAEEFAQMRPAIEVFPDIVEQYRHQQQEKQDSRRRERDSNPR